ncbi:MAG: type III pantothenate kinase [Chloroflexota bacterium]|nr:type III pantothenate kinase [Chloroflexota bacterium]MDE2684367.1 type III pantothenate kinase [Chloroflexota bacterium]
MLLTIDIGNTAVTMGVFYDEPAAATGVSGASPLQRLVTTLRVATDSRRLADEYGILVKNLLEFRGISSSDITAASICSVVPPLTGLFEDLCRRYFGLAPLLVNSQIDLGMPVRYDNPRDVGADRIVDAVAAVELYGAPVIIVDLGTATVFDAVSRDREYLGGAIAPGINLSADALYDNTSLLRRVELVAPAEAVGRNTTAALQSGLVLGYAGLVTTMVERFKAEIGSDAQVVGTGGLVTVIADHSPVFNDINQELTLVGLYLIYRMNTVQHRRSRESGNPECLCAKDR